MGRPSLFLLILLAIVGSWLYFNDVPMDRLPWGRWEGEPVGHVAAHQIGTHSDRFRIATFNLDQFDAAKAGQRDIVAAMAHVMSQFHIIAIQEIRSDEHHLVPTIVDELNRLQIGRYDFVVGPRVGRGRDQQQFGFIFDRSTVEIDQHATYSVNDPDDLLNHEPLVACFRANRQQPDKAFTFSLVNVHTYEPEVDRESGLMRTIFGHVRNDGRFEDDVILLGSFGKSAGDLARDDLPGMTFIVGETRRDIARDNLVLDAAATTEFTGRSGVYDLVRELNVEASFADRISRHSPVWAEFSVAEGGTPGRVASPAGNHHTR